MNVLDQRNCPVCLFPASSSREYLPLNVNENLVSEFTFASRKAPEYMSNHMVKCKSCELVFADSPPSQAELANAYHIASFDSNEEANDAAAAYVKAFGKVLNKLSGHLSVLEIGTGTGIFLEQLQKMGFSNLVGVEPSEKAISAAPAHRRGWIRQGIFEATDFAENSFDVIACFMTLEHVRDPKVVVESALRLLKPGGMFLSVTHDYQHPVNKVLGRKSPIVDIEHMQLFNRKSIRHLYKVSGYCRVISKSFSNRYALSYWIRLFPLPQSIKLQVLSFISSKPIGRLKLSVNVGNTAAIAFKQL